MLYVVMEVVARALRLVPCDCVASKLGRLLRLRMPRRVARSQ